MNARLHEGIGRALAQEAMKLLAPGGSLTVVTRDTTTFPQPAVDRAMASFRQELRQSGVMIAAVQAIQVDPLRPVEVPSGDFYQLLRHGAAGDVLVSFMGPPLLDEEQRAVLGAIKPQIVAFCSGGLPDYVNLRLLAEQKLLHAAVVSRPLKASSSGLVISGRATFDDLYIRAGRAELVQMPELGASHEATR